MKEQKTDDFVIGRHPAMAALKSGQDINKVFVQSGLKSDAIQEIVSAARKRSIVVSQQAVLHVVRQMQRFVQPGQAVFKFSVLNLAQVIFF